MNQNFLMDIARRGAAIATAIEQETIRVRAKEALIRADVEERFWK